MIKTIIHENSYKDSVVLMLLTNEIAKMAGVKQVSIMMATPANKDILDGSGLLTEEVKSAKADDIAIVMEIETEDIVEDVLSAIDEFLNKEATHTKSESIARTWDQAHSLLPDANLALLSIPGIYAAHETRKALDQGYHVFLFSDNVAIEDEVELKKLAHEKGLLFMGPDSGTGIISGVPLAFTNRVRTGKIGIVGASGTGIQEVSTLVHKLGQGVSSAIGTGGRDLNEAVGAITMLDSLHHLSLQPDTEVLVVISKPPAPSVKEKVEDFLRTLKIPVVTVFLGDTPTFNEPNIYHAYTLDEAAQAAVRLAQGKDTNQLNLKSEKEVVQNEGSNQVIKGYYSGGTLAVEAAMLIAKTLDFPLSEDHEKGFMLNYQGYEIIDLGDDAYTQGRPHPMIDPHHRIEMIENVLNDENVGYVLFDLVLGYGSHENMASALAPSILAVQEKAKEMRRSLVFVASVCGTELDPQNYQVQKEILENIGVLVFESNAKAVIATLQMSGHEFNYVNLESKEISSKGLVQLSTSSLITDLLSKEPRTINVGLRSFYDNLVKENVQTVQFDWQPVAGGDQKLMEVLDYLERDVNIEKSNLEMIDRIKNGVPVLRDVVSAKSVIKELNGKVLLHAGPPIEWSHMTDPMQGSCVGAVLFEGWANDEAEARELLNTGQVSFIPCQNVNAVGPMGGITSGNMPVLVVDNSTYGTTAYCQMNEGIGAVLRFGAYSQEVIDRLIWMRDVLGPVLGAAIRELPDGVNLNPMIAKAIAMGDEFHQRNIAASLIFLKELAPIISSLDLKEEDRTSVLTFLANTDQFFLNVMMASCKAVMDGARQFEEGTVVTIMARNGENFGIKIAGMGDQWFTAPVNTPQGLYFTGYSGDDASKDLGDSAITETFGVGGMAMIAAPAVTRFVGTGGFADALRISNELDAIVMGHNSNLIIPTWDFKGAHLGIDAMKVVSTGITPVINTGIAHKKAGLGQIGAGTVHPPLECFEKAITAYAKKLGM